MFRIKILKADEHASPAGKLADAEIHFTEDAGALAGLKLIGFAIWEARTANARRNVTFPARQYSVNGERRSFALLRPVGDHSEALRDAIVAEYERIETEEDDARQMMRSATHRDADNDYARDQEQRRATSDRAAGMTENQIHTAIARGDLRLEF